MRYFLTPRRGAGDAETQLDQALASLPHSAQLVFDRRLSVTGRRLIAFEVDSDLLRTPRLPQELLLEPWIEHQPESSSANQPAGSGGQGADGLFSIKVISAGRPLPLTTVLLIVDEGELSAVTGADGGATFDWPASSGAHGLIAAPYSGHWEMIEYEPQPGSSIECPPLPEVGSTGWWHGAIDSRPGDPREGSGIRIGVIDTGCGPHPHLGNVEDAGCFLNLDHITTGRAGRDPVQHGTHVTGIIASRPANGDGFAGIAVGAEVVTARAFDEETVANQGDLANAIEYLGIERRVDLINLSLSAATLSSILEDAILFARDHGVLCLCAVGNYGGAVRYPAALEAAVGIGAAGRSGWGVEGSSAAARVPDDESKLGSDGYYLANFSCFGSGLNTLGPGVGIISTVPARGGFQSPYAAMCGTSMACPAVTASLAVMLASDGEYLGQERGADRADRARRVLEDSCLDLNLAAAYQGRGLVRISR